MIITLLRSVRIGPFAVFDFIISYIAVYFLAPYLSKFFLKLGIRINTEQWLWLTLPIAVLAHIIARSDTVFTNMFLNPTSGWIAKTVIVIMLCMVYIRRDKK